MYKTVFSSVKKKSLSKTTVIGKSMYDVHIEKPRYQNHVKYIYYFTKWLEITCIYGLLLKLFYRWY